MPRDHRLYLEDILEAVQRIREYTEDMDEETFSMDKKTQDAVIRNLQVIGEAARLMPESVMLQTPKVEWRKIAGMRNILIHEYFGISHSIVWDIVVHKLDDLDHVCRKILSQ